MIYTSEKEGSDESGDGSAQKPFKTVMQVKEQIVFTVQVSYSTNISFIKTLSFGNYIV